MQCCQDASHHGEWISEVGPGETDDDDAEFARRILAALPGVTERMLSLPAAGPATLSPSGSAQCSLMETG